MPKEKILSSPLFVPSAEEGELQESSTCYSAENNTEFRPESQENSGRVSSQRLRMAKPQEFLR